MTELDAQTKARIVAEERLRLQVRADLEKETVQANPPPYWGGFLLNLLIIGLGFVYIGKVWTGAAWFFLALVGVTLSGGILWPVFAFGVLIHYYVSYNVKFKA